MKEQMIAYLQGMMDDFRKEQAIYGRNDRRVDKKLDALLACTQMVEALIGEPINLIGGKIKVGF